MTPTIHTQDNREDWRCKYWGDYAQRRWRAYLQRWRPSFWWRITHTARGILRRS